jgi:hypothetical protein
MHAERTLTFGGGTGFDIVNLHRPTLDTAASAES